MTDITWPFIASIIYTFLWSISFYGQIYENFKNKSVQGFSMNYLIMNICGYTFYALYSSVGYFTNIQGAGTVVLADLLYVYHAVFCVAIEGIQSVYYPKGKNKPSKKTILLCLGLWTFIIIQILFTVAWKVIPWTDFWNPVSCLGYCKLVLSLIKCLPAMYWNYKRKATKGWSIHMILCDFFGGLFSLISGQLSTENGINVTKLFLGILTIVVDIVFMVQHFILYKKPRQEEKKQEEEKLLN